MAQTFAQGIANWFESENKSTARNQQFANFSTSIRRSIEQSELLEHLKGCQSADIKNLESIFSRAYESCDQNLAECQREFSLKFTQISDKCIKKLQKLKDVKNSLDQKRKYFEQSNLYLTKLHKLTQQHNEKISKLYRQVNSFLDIVIIAGEVVAASNPVIGEAMEAAAHVVRVPLNFFNHLHEKGIQSASYRYSKTINTSEATIDNLKLVGGKLQQNIALNEEQLKHNRDFLYNNKNKFLPSYF